MGLASIRIDSASLSLSIPADAYSTSFLFPHQHTTLRNYFSSHIAGHALTISMIGCTALRIAGYTPLSIFPTPLLKRIPALTLIIYSASSLDYSPQSILLAITFYF
jgi:hypothetical protein